MSETVILIHGLLRPKNSMWWLGRQLSKAGFYPVIFGYRSRKGLVSEHAHSLYNFIKEQGLLGEPINFVTHSLGSIVLRNFLVNYPDAIKAKRAVNLGPPHLGSKTALALSKWRIFRWILGPSFKELYTYCQDLSKSGGTTPTDYFGAISSKQIEIGVIAGLIPVRRGYYQVLSRPNDGIVEIEETRLPGMTDHIVLKGTHSLLMYQRAVVTQTVHFLRYGKFIREKG